ncbi:MAG: hypothetical protein WBD71_14355, partial [Xanthobacteraceae bacterium]
AMATSHAFIQMMQQIIVIAPPLGIGIHFGGTGSQCEGRSKAGMQRVLRTQPRIAFYPDDG